MWSCNCMLLIKNTEMKMKHLWETIHVFDAKCYNLRLLEIITIIFIFSGVVGMDNYIYAVGGYDSSCQLKSVERYNTCTKTWEFVAPMRSPRSALSVCVLSGKLYVLGKIWFLSCLFSLHNIQPCHVPVNYISFFIYWQCIKL